MLVIADYNTKTKYYFYKLYNDFFDSDVIEYLKGTENGSKTIVIYLQFSFILILHYHHFLYHILLYS